MNDSIFTLQYADSIPPLSKTAQSGDLEKIKKLLSKGNSARTPDNRGWTPIHFSVAANQIEALKLLLKLNQKVKKQLVNLQTWENITPLILALKAKQPSEELIKVLLKAGADANERSHLTLPPLHLACLKSGNLNIVKLLLEFGADVNIQDEICLLTPLHVAVLESRDLEVIKFLLDLSDLTLKNTNDRTAFLEACNSNFLDAVLLFLKKDKNLVNAHTGVPPLAYASLTGNLKLVQVLIDSGADINCRCKAFVKCKSEDDLLLLDQENFLPIHSSLKNVDVFKLLLKLTNVEKITELESDHNNFPLFVLINGNESLYQILLQSHLPDKLKTCNSSVLIKQIKMSHSEMEEVIIEKFTLLFKYNFSLEPEKIFNYFVNLMSEEELCRCWKFIHLLAQMGISGCQSKNVNVAVNALKSATNNELNLFKSTVSLLSKSVLSLKQYSRVALRNKIKSEVSNDWSAVQMIKESKLPDCLKKFVFFESFY